MVGYWYCYLDFNKIANIIKEIAVPIYTNMHTLYLGDNNISSIEQLIDLNSPDLQKLYLSKVTSIQIIIKLCH